ncbi:MAG: Fe-S cluster assembly protein SufB [Candidatus Anstonellales archaeon]
MGEGQEEPRTFERVKRVAESISERHGEPAWMLKKRMEAVEALKKVKEIELPLEWKEIIVEIEEKPRAYRWEDVPEEIRKKLDEIGIPEAEKKQLAGLGAQYNYAVVYSHLKEWAEKEGIILEDMKTAVKRYEKIVKKHFGTLVKPNNFGAALNTALWSGGVFLLIPKGKKVRLPIQGFFYISREGIAQFERSMVIVEEGGEVEYIEGCTAPVWHKFSLHAGCVEVFVKKDARLKFTTIQNWSKNVVNLANKRARLEENAYAKWVSGMLGSKLTMAYPTIELAGDGAKTEGISVSFAGKGQRQDTGIKVLHMGKNTSSKITSKSVSKDGGEAIYRGYVFSPHKKMKSFVKCDSLILNDGIAKSFPVAEGEANINHEARVGRVSDEILFYLRSRGFSEKEALGLVVNGFVDEFMKELKIEFALEFYKLLKMEIEGG